MTAYRNITNTPLADAATVTSGKGVAFEAWNGKTLGFFGHDLGSSAPTQGRVPAFLGLAERTGGIYVENAPSVAEALAETGLDFEVRHNPLTARRMQDVLAVVDGEPTMVSEPTGELLDLGEWVSTVAYPKDGGQPFAIAPTSKRYTIVQNDDLLSLGEGISEGRLRALGAFGKPVGSRVYAAFEIGDGFTVGGGDPYRNFVSLVNTHDRNGGYGIMGPIRLGCTNQTTSTFGRKATPRFTIRHTGNATVKLDEARRILGLAHQYVEVLQAEAETLLAAPMSTDQFVVYAKHVWGAQDEDKLSDKSKTLVRMRTDELLTLLASESCEFGRGTAYAGFQAVTEHMDFFGTVKSADPDRKRFERIMAGQLDTAKDRAWNLAAEFATA